MSRVQIVLTIVFAACETMVYGGPYFGWSSLQPLLIEEGFFSSGCPNQSSKSACQTQTEQLHLVITIATALPPIVATAVIYTFERRCGNWFLRTLNLATVVVSNIVMFVAAADPPHRSWALHVAATLAHVGGFGLLISNLRTGGDLMPTRRALVVSFVNGCFSSSPLVFLTFYQLHGRYAVALRTLFGVYALGTSIFAVQTFLLTPKWTASPDDRYGYRELPCAAEAGTEKKKNVSMLQIVNEQQANVSLIDDSESLKECLMRTYTWTGFVHYSVSCFGTTWFGTTFNSWIATKLEHGDQADETRLYTTVYGCIASCAVLVAPCVGFAADKLRARLTRGSSNDDHHHRVAAVKSASIFLIMVDGTLILMYALSLVASARVQFFTMSVQLVARALVFSASGYFASAVYPSRHFCFVYGLTEACGGLVLLLQYPLTLVVFRFFAGDFTVVNATLMCLCALNLFHPINMLRVIGAYAKKISTQ